LIGSEEKMEQELIGSLGEQLEDEIIGVKENDIVLDSNRFLFLSGTPIKALYSGEFEDQQVYS
jgi:hypothetical protein